MAFAGRTLQIDSNGDGRFDAAQDVSIALVGVGKVTVDAGGHGLVLG